MTTLGLVGLTFVAISFVCCAALALAIAVSEITDAVRARYDLQRRLAEDEEVAQLEHVLEISR